MASESGKDRHRRELRTARLLKTKQTWQVILNHVRNGGSLLNLAESWDVRYSDLITWVRADKKRLEEYQQACDDRAGWTDEMILNELRDVAGAKHLSPTMRDKLHALELIAKNRRLLVDKAELEVGGRLEDLLAQSFDDSEPPAAADAQPPQ
jgi:hypothetical protein